MGNVKSEIKRLRRRAARRLAREKFLQTIVTKGGRKVGSWRDADSLLDSSELPLAQSRPRSLLGDYSAYMNAAREPRVPAVPLSTFASRMRVGENEGRRLGVDFNQITPRLFLGGEVYGLRGAEALRQAGVTHVINCQLENDDSRLLGLVGIKSLQVGIPDDFRPKPAAWFETGQAFARQALVDDPAAIVYVHCHMGWNRAPSMAHAILMDQGLSEADSLAAIVAGRPAAWPVYRQSGRVSDSRPPLQVA